MEEVEYKENFKKLKQFQEKQNRQKMRGLNDYNTFNVVRKASLEVGMHSNVIYSFINPDGLHYQNDLFLNLFIEKVLGFSIEEFGTVFEVNAEEQTNKNKRIDFTIKSKNYFIGIEMKVNAGDSDNQISDYYEDLEAKADKEIVLMYYLTKNGKDAPKSSKNDVDITRVSFEKHILNWLEACQDEVRNITNLYIALEDYKNIVKKITNQYEENIMSLSNYIKEDESIYKMALEIQDTLPTVRKNIIDSFFKKVISSLKEELGSEWRVELKGDFSKIRKSPLIIYKDSWIANKKNNFIFGFEFYDKDYTVGTFGIFPQNKSLDITNEVIQEFEEALNSLNGFDTKEVRDEDWLYWDYLPNIKGSDDLANYIMFNTEVEEVFIKEIIDLIDIFERKSHLITNINNYLNTKEEL